MYNVIVIFNVERRIYINIGLNIKKLRLSKGMTQEELAEYTGVSSRAISRWENSITFPDITLLPILANIFEVTVDELLDVDVYKKKQDIKQILDENNNYKHTGEMERSIDLLKTSLNKYPNNFEIMNELMNSLFLYYCAKDGERKHLLNEIIELGEKIYNKCNDKEIKESAIQTLVYVYPKVNEIDKAKKLIDNQPPIYMSKECLLDNVLEGEELDKLLKHNIIKITEWFHSIIINMSCDKEPHIKIELKNKYLKLMDLIFEGKNMGFYHERMYKSYLYNARNYAKINMVDEAINSLLECVNHAIKLEASTITKYESLLLEGIINDTSLIHTNSTITNKEFISSYINKNEMSLVRQNGKFQEVEKKLLELK